MDYHGLIKEAKIAMEFSYSPYSGFKVGAAVLTKSGKVYRGTNIENASYGGTICAERTALVKAISEGETEFLAIAVVSMTGEFTSPCGICRQFITEFGLDIDLVFEGKNGNSDEILVFKSKDLLPHSFGPQDLEK